MSRKNQSVTSAESNLLESMEEASNTQEQGSALEKYMDIPAEWDPSIELTFEPFVDTWKFPQWCRLDEFAYGWLNKNDKDEALRAFEISHWRLVQRVNHVSAPDADFNMHGLVERMGQVLIFRPRWLDDKIRNVPVVKHMERTKEAEAKLTRGAVQDERGRDIAVFEPMVSRESDVTMFVEEPTTGEMVAPTGG